MTDNKIWSDRDIELNLQRSLAIIIAKKRSGVADAIPEEDDFHLADRCAALMEADFNDWVGYYSRANKYMDTDRAHKAFKVLTLNPMGLRT